MKLSPLFCFFLLLTILSLSCQLFAPEASPSETPTEPNPPISSSTPPTPQTSPSPEEQIIETPTRPPSSESPSQPVPPPTEPITSVYSPKGMISLQENGSKVVFYDLLGQIMAQVSLPGPHNIGRDSFHYAGKFTEPFVPTTFAYFSYENTMGIQLFQNGQFSLLIPSQSFVSMVGAAGLPFLSYSVADFTGTGLDSRLFAASLVDLPFSQPQITFNDPESWALIPLAVKVENNQPVGVWFSRRAYGIGGDIVFEPRRGLYYLDLVTHNSTQFLEKEVNPSSFSPDFTWFAFSYEWGGKPISIIPNMDTNRTITIPLLPESDRGAGNAVFSPNNQYVAWMEGSGYMMAEVPNFHATIRIANTNGQVIINIPALAFNGLIGAGNVAWVQPAGWLDDQTLLVQVRLEDWDIAGLVRVKFDGTGMTYFAPGVFLGFIYP